MVYVRKRQKENSEALLRRFSRKMQGSGLLRQARKNRFFEKPLNKRGRRLKAQRGNEIRDMINEMKKLGKLPEEYGPHANRRRRR